MNPPMFQRTLSRHLFRFSVRSGVFSNPLPSVTVAFRFGEGAFTKGAGEPQGGKTGADTFFSQKQKVTQNLGFDARSGTSDQALG